MNTIPVTLKGLKKIEKELYNLKTITRFEIVQDIARARELGDLSENAEYHSAKEQQGFTEAKIKSLEEIISRAKVIDPKEITSNTVMFGATVTILNLDTSKSNTYQIVGEYEANIENNLLSYKSPLGKGLISKKVGDVVEINQKSHSILWEITKIEYI